MKLENVKILTIDKASYSGVIFDRDAVDEMLITLNARMVFGYYLSDDNVHHSIPSHRILSFKIVDNKLFADILVLDSSSGEVLQTYLTRKAISHARYVPSGFGYIEENRIKDFKFVGINIVKDNIEVIG